MMIMMMMMNPITTLEKTEKNIEVESKQNRVAFYSEENRQPNLNHHNPDQAATKDE